ncbi:MAG: ABC transporter substrate-binding protein [Bradyrhizobium sp.]|jgi:branched-chain amino acid transport system substrate-binding protein|uniref:ABC transporter substrate-binding protein n=2 Tax=Pseudomonadota TaxID=1224 RepID=A0ABS5G969_9BRAD|nr:MULTISPECIES: ABC transporter substrate-binding protein [Bradyrhizobium]ABQ32997.1 amino acid/amide ABC transporter substrate-binding protein, HAAT family [Bradyrhizobium sp. BTAi1]MBR1137819.1 ABC transporter substrate-binding protein [Bradyrhizobium denitrificans]MDU0955816.1 ABC transporter substrate-binding protein [Bradyrhizobium sp.]MDU1490739.1 ABC transporter substrate-binding protein [Bradyrhizobium sp.]MDU1540917.1 ABC transporter substrate-binding protein [Bradyrhizobium sp.]
MKTSFWLAGAAALLFSSTAFAGDTIKIGFVSTFSGPTAVIGNDMRNSFELALDHLGRKMNGKPVEVIYEDDQQKPDVGKQKTEKLVQSDKVDFIVGYIWSNVLLASLKTAVDSQTFLISANAGPSQLAGELCSPYVFSTSWQNDQTPAAMGLYMNQKGVKSVFLIGPNYAAGKDMLAGLKSTFKGQIVGEEYTVWPSQLDFSAELSKARASGAESIFVFYPGAAGVQFLNQYVQAGLKEKMPLYTAFTVDELSLPLQKDNAIGVPGAQEWVNDLPNEQNKTFVADYRKKYTGLRPTYYGAQAYDAAQLINSAVVAVKGDTSKKDAMKAEMEKANFKSLRGAFKFGNNHIPIQSFYLQDVVKDADGQLSLKTVATIVENDQDRFHDKCPMK